MLEEIFGAGTVFSEGVLYIPLENFSCSPTKRHITAAMVRKIYDYFNGIFDDLVDEWGTPIGWSENGVYEVKLTKSLSENHLRITYDVSFMD